MAKKSTPQASQGLQMPDLQWLETPEEKTAKATAAGTDDATTLKALQDQIAKLSGDLDNQRQTNMALMAQPMIQAAPQAPSVNMKNLPDPTLDPEAYAAEVAQRTTAYIGQVQQLQQAQAASVGQSDRRVEALWQDFNEKYPQFSKNPDQVEFAATKVAERAKARGIDVGKYIFGAAPVFMADVAKEMEKVFGKPVDPDADDEATGDDVRTAGIAGGQESGGRAVKAEDRGPAFQPNSMFGDVQAWQARTGFTR
jgi:hypothetical protein